MELDDFNYELPQERIAQYPLDDRSKSKLLHYKEGRIGHYEFEDIVNLIPQSSHLILNDTKVIPARFRIAKSTGALIEIFIINPMGPSKVLSEVMQTKNRCQWECIIGNKKRWRGQNLSQRINLAGDWIDISFELLEKESNLVEFTWEGNFTFAQIVEAAGQVPLPPYLNREAESEDKERYQTVYSVYEGAVAAPTAGLHFTDSVLKTMKETGNKLDYLTLHVGAGTFLPISTRNIKEHPMHNEQVVVSKKTLISLAASDRPMIPVGTTSMRSLESLYWYGIKLSENKEKNFIISQNAPYKRGFKDLPTRQEAFGHVIDFMNENDLQTLVGHTEIFIYPGYQFQVCDGLITNFHQPKSTLILLVAALIGDHWKEVYNEALESGYRFLSYGDSSLLMRS